jgi:hypothetical protein
MRGAVLERERLGAWRWQRWRGAGQRLQRAEQLDAAGGTEPVAPSGTRERASAGLERFAGGAGAERGRRRAGGASVHVVARGRWRCGCAQARYRSGSGSAGHGALVDRIVRELQGSSGGHG